MSRSIQTLTEKEKQTLRLVVRGHDAKSMALHLGLSVHTINERLRDARRKLSVSSSREAARLLLDSEGGVPDSAADKGLGEAGAPGTAAEAGAAIDGRRTYRAAWVIAGVVIMSVFLGIAALVSLPHSTPAPAEQPAGTHAAQADATQSARAWLAMVDAGRWPESWQATGEAFRQLNTVQAWTQASEAARVPLGAMLSRENLSRESVPAPPDGLEMVKFRTDFANRPAALETLTLSREDGAWRVVGYLIN